MEITFSVPFMTIERFADETGLSSSYVRKKCLSGEYPTLPKNAKQEITLIDVVALNKRLQHLVDIGQESA